MNFNILSNESFQRKNGKRGGIININKGENKKMKLKDIKTITEMINDMLVTKYKQKPEIVVTGLGINGRRLLKGVNADIAHMHETDDEYLNGRVSETTKFDTFTQIEIYYYIIPE